MDQLRTFMVRSWCDRVHSWYGVGVTAYIHGTELIRFRKVTLSGFCVHCVLYSRIHLADFMFLLYIAQSRVLGFFSNRPNWDPPPPQPQESVSPPLWFRGEGVTCLRVRGSLVCVWGGHFTELMWPRKVTLRSQKISMKWLWPVKVTFKVIKRPLQVFCWSCDGVPLKWNKKNWRASSSSLRIKWAYSRLSIRMIGQYL